MPSKSNPMSKTDLAAYEAKRDLAAELLDSVRQMKAVQTQVVTSPVIAARKKLGCPSRSSLRPWTCPFDSGRPAERDLPQLPVRRSPYNRQRDTPRPASAVGSRMHLMSIRQPPGLSSAA